MPADDHAPVEQEPPGCGPQKRKNSERTPEFEAKTPDRRHLHFRTVEDLGQLRKRERKENEKLNAKRSNVADKIMKKSLLRLQTGSSQMDPKREDSLKSSKRRLATKRYKIKKPAPAKTTTDLVSDRHMDDGNWINFKKLRAMYLNSGTKREGEGKESRSKSKKGKETQKRPPNKKGIESQPKTPKKWSSKGKKLNQGLRGAHDAKKVLRGEAGEKRGVDSHSGVAGKTPNPKLGIMSSYPNLKGLSQKLRMQSAEALSKLETPTFPPKRYLLS
jgi:hypothetical protein